jgi:C4-dicarboxylate-specific signal transduction histidine kinase
MRLVCTGGLELRMTIGIHIRRICTTAGLVVFLAVSLGCPAEFAAETKRVVLVLHSFGQGFKPWSEYGKAIRAELNRRSPWPLNRHAALGEMSASLAHDLNQPLGASLANAETAELIVNSPSLEMAGIKEILADIKRDDQRAGEIIRRLRNILKKAPSEAKDFDLNEVVREVFDFLAVQAGACDVTRSNVAAPQPLQVHGDRIQIQQVILSLIINGMEAVADAPDGQRAIIGRAAPLDDTFAEISISDVGPGIASNDLEKVFNPFFTNKTEGMGMGLSIARTIIEAHEGRTWAEN